MTAPLPQINLYNRALLLPAPRLSLRAMLALLLVGAGGQVALGLYLDHEKAALQGQRSALDTQVQQARQTLGELQARNAQRRPDPALSHSVEQLEQRLQHREQAWQWLQAQTAVARPVYSTWLLALSAAHQEGVWLSRVEMQADTLGLEGHTLDPALLPDWLQRMQAQPALGGLAFSGLQLEAAGGADRLSERSGEGAAVKPARSAAGAAHSFRLTGLGAARKKALGSPP